jgi:hypothetical protein
MTRDEYEATLKKNAYLEIIDFLNRIASTGEPNEIGGEWLAHIPHNTTLQELLNQRGLTGKFNHATGHYFVERAPIRGKR